MHDKDEKSWQVSRLGDGVKDGETKRWSVSDPGPRGRCLDQISFARVSDRAKFISTLCAHLSAHLLAHFPAPFHLYEAPICALTPHPGYPHTTTDVQATPRTPSMPPSNVLRLATALPLPRRGQLDRQTDPPAAEAVAHGAVPQR